MASFKQGSLLLEARLECHLDPGFPKPYPGPFQRILHPRYGLLRDRAPLPLEIDDSR
jgi:hypothetical protein